jgi:hypothetical protein
MPTIVSSLQHSIIPTLYTTFLIAYKYTFKSTVNNSFRPTEDLSYLTAFLSAKFLAFVTAIASTYKCSKFSSKQYSIWPAIGLSVFHAYITASLTSFVTSLKSTDMYS